MLPVKAVVIVAIVLNAPSAIAAEEGPLFNSGPDKNTVIEGPVSSSEVSTKEVSFSATGSVNLAYGLSSIQYGTGSAVGSSHAMYLNFGGPAVKFELSDIAVGASLFPSLKMILNAPSGVNAVTAALGFGPYLSFGRVTLSLPIYFPSATTTDVALGLGYRL